MMPVIAAIAGRRRCKALSEDAAAFISEYISSDEESATVRDEFGLYPYGPRAWFCTISVEGRTDRIDYAASNGINCIFSYDDGPYGGDPPEYAYAWNTHNMKCVGRLYDSATYPYTGDPVPRVKDHIAAVLGDATFNIALAGWADHGEEPDVSGSSSDKAFMQQIYNTIASDDTKKRPYTCSCRGDTGESTISYYAPALSAVMKQNYLIRHNEYDYSRNATTQPLQRRTNIDFVTWQVDAAENSGASYSGLPKPVTVMFPMYIDPDNAVYRTEAWMNNFITHDVIAAMMYGAHGYYLYTLTSGESGQITLDWQREAYYSVTKIMAEEGLGKAFLWGQHRSDVSQDSTSENKTFNYNHYSTPKNAPSITFRNIQHGDTRWLILINTDPGDNHSDSDMISVSLGGAFGDGLMAIDVLTGDDMGMTSSSVSVTLKPRQCRAIKVIPKDGYCGGNEPQPPCVEPIEVGVNVSTCYPEYWTYDGV